MTDTTKVWYEPYNFHCNPYLFQLYLEDRINEWYAKMSGAFEQEYQPRMFKK